MIVGSCRRWTILFKGLACRLRGNKMQGYFSTWRTPPPNRPDVDLVFLGQAKRTVYVSDNDGEGWLYGFFLDPEECFGVWANFEKTWVVEVF